MFGKISVGSSVFSLMTMCDNKYHLRHPPPFPGLGLELPKYERWQSKSGVEKFSSTKSVLENLWIFWRNFYWRNMLYNELYEENVFNFSDGVCVWLVLRVCMDCFLWYWDTCKHSWWLELFSANKESTGQYWSLSVVGGELNFNSRSQPARFEKTWPMQFENTWPMRFEKTWPHLKIIFSIWKTWSSLKEHDAVWKGMTQFEMVGPSLKETWPNLK